MCSNIEKFLAALKEIGWNFTTRGKVVAFSDPVSDIGIAAERTAWVGDLLKTSTRVVAFYYMPYYNQYGDIIEYRYRPAIGDCIEFDVTPIEGGHISDN